MWKNVTVECEEEDTCTNLITNTFRTRTDNTDSNKHDLPVFLNPRSPVELRKVV